MHCHARQLAPARRTAARRGAQLCCPLPKQGLGLPPPHAPFCLRMSLSPRLSAMPCVLDLSSGEGGSKGGKLRVEEPGGKQVLLCSCTAWPASQ